jgi:16S rRNA (cytidine1402-2'-O)-methyltransferase
VLFEAPRRVLSTLDALIVELGDRDAALCRELTKAHETIYRGSLSQLQAFVRNDANQQRGEMVLVIRGCDSEAVQLNAEVEALLDRLVKELPPRRAAAVVADVTGLPVRVLYQAILDKK